MKLPLIVLTPLSLLLVVFLLSNQAAPIVYAQPTGWVELVGERTRTGKVFFDFSRGVRAIDMSVAKVHYDGPDWKDIDNTLVPSLANVPTLGLVDLEMTTDDYEFYALQTLNTIPLWFYRNKSVPDTYVTFNPQALQWTNDLDQIDQLSMPQSVIGTVTDNRLHWENAYGPGINLTLSAQAGRLAKALTLEAMPRAPAQYILDGENPALELQFIFGIPSGPDAPEIWIDGVLWGQSTRTETIGTVEFKIAGETIFSFARPTVFDSGFGIANPSFVFTKQGPNLRVAIRVPLAFLQDAVYPVVIDPTIDVEVEFGADDGYRTDSTLDTTSAWQVAGNSVVNGIYDAFSRFGVVNLAQGSTVTVAYLTAVPRSSSTDGTQDTNIYFEDVDDATAPTTRADMDGRTRTLAFTAWDDVDFTIDVPTNSPSIVSVVQEILDRPGWSSGNHMQMLLDDDGSPADASLQFWQSDGNSAKDMKLHIETAVWSNTAPTITNKISSETVDSNTSYNRSFSATDPDTNQTLQWELNTTSASFTITVWNAGNRTTYVTATPDISGSFWVNVTVGDNATTGNSTDYVNYTLIVQEPTLVQPETLLENALFFLVGFIPFLMAIGIGFWKEQGSMLFIGGLIGILLGLWVMVTVYWIFGFSFVGISILFMYIGWVNRDYMG